MDISLGPYFRTSIRYNFQRLSAIGTTICNDNQIAETELKTILILTVTPAGLTAGESFVRMFNLLGIRRYGVNQLALR